MNQRKSDSGIPVTLLSPVGPHGLFLNTDLHARLAKKSIFNEGKLTFLSSALAKLNIKSEPRSS
jgi:hypothetical protein